MHQHLSSFECTISLNATDHMRTWDILWMWTSSELLLSQIYPRDVLAATQNDQQNVANLPINKMFIHWEPSKMQSCDTSLHRRWPSVQCTPWALETWSLLGSSSRRATKAGIFPAKDTYRFPRNLLAAKSRWQTVSQSITCSVDWESYHQDTWRNISILLSLGRDISLFSIIPIEIHPWTN
jgi:hypothetical protein